ncbi:MAG TPA: zinc-binding dehydrogenase [Polyangiales bacterium]
MPEIGLELRSLIKESGELELSFVEAPIPEPAADEIVMRVEGTPISPSDLWLLLGGADVSRAQLGGTQERPVLSAPVPNNVMMGMRLRLGQSLPVGNEGAGTVIKAGSGPGAQALLGKKVAALAGGMYAEYRLLKAAHCMPLPADASAADGASAFVNPLTALGMVETMRLEGHRALVHTAAASNLGQMLVRICQQDEVGLVNIVRRPEHVETLRALGAKYVVNSSAPSFFEDLVKALRETGATLAFDAIGGGKLASQILTAMEVVAGESMKEYSRYGSSVHKQVYIYGGLDRGPTELSRSYGLTWGVAGWLVTPFLQRIGPEGQKRLRTRVATELKTTFHSPYSRELSLREMLSLDEIRSFTKLSTGDKPLINPSKR